MPRSFVIYLGLFLLLPCWVGCGNKPQASTQKTENRAAQRRIKDSVALLSNVTTKLRRLPESTQVDLAPPRVVVDARATTDGEDVMAVLAPQPDAPDPRLTSLLLVPSGNARFKSSGVRSGDTIKYFAQYDNDTKARIKETGEAQIIGWEAINLEVAQVLNDNGLLFVGSLPADQSELPQPYRLEIWRNTDDRMQEISNRLGRYTKRRDPPMAWQPSGDEQMLSQMREQLNQWYRQGVAEVKEPKSLPALIETLDPKLLGDEKLAEFLSTEELVTGGFRPHETRLLQEAVWLRDIAAWARGDSLDRVEQTTELFDWTVRNLQLIENGAPHFAWELLLYGQATAEQRAWIFALLCRQQGTTAGVLLLDDPKVLSIVLIDGQAYLFDPELGLPLNKENGEPATLAQLQEDDTLLRSYDLPEMPYAVTSESLRGASVAIVAEPFALSRRAAELGSRLSGKDRLVLKVDIDQTAKQFAEAIGERSISLWELPIRTYQEKLTANQSARNREVRAFLPLAWRPTLWKGRTLHFRGHYEEPKKSSRNVLAQVIDDHRDAMKLYRHPRVRPKESELDADALSSDIKREIYSSAKVMATFWHGQLAYERGDYENAVNWLTNKVLQGKYAEPLADGIRYNLARVYEAQGKLKEAAKLLEEGDSPQRQGNLLRAKRLVPEETQPQETQPEETSAKEGKEAS